jgi:hypothetical protein
MVMDRAQNHRGLVTMFVARSDWGPRAERVGGAEPGAERLQTERRTIVAQPQCPLRGRSGGPTRSVGGAEPGAQRH